MDKSLHGNALLSVDKQRVKREQDSGSHTRSDIADAVAVDKKGKRSEDYSPSSYAYFPGDADDVDIHSA